MALLPSATFATNHSARFDSANSFSTGHAKRKVVVVFIVKLVVDKIKIVVYDDDHDDDDGTSISIDIR